LFQIFSFTSSGFGTTQGINSYFLFHIPNASADIDAHGFRSAAFFGTGNTIVASSESESLILSLLTESLEDVLAFLFLICVFCSELS